VASAATYADWAKFVADVTIPDGTNLAPGATFTKTWRLTNIGTSTWTTSYKLVFDTGESMGASTSIALTKSVKPGESIDLSAEMTAPGTAGNYRGYWKLKNAAGQNFGIGSNANSPFWVDIKVSTSFGVAYDFTTKICDATWSSAKGILPCPGSEGSNDGYALKLAAPKYENGLVDSTPGILAVPQNTYNGYIAGVYPSFKIQKGDKFQAVVGCEFGATACYVKFRLDYKIGNGDLKNFWSFYEKLDGKYYRANVDLSPLAGQDVKLILTVHSAGLATGDRAIWGNPVILRGDSGGATPTNTPTTTATPTVTITPGGPTLTPSSTPPPATSCDRAAFVADVTIPDGAAFTPGTTFTKIWRLKNVGTCTWTSDYKVIFADGDALGATVSNLPKNVAPGQTVDIAIKMTAPNDLGTYRGYWKVKNATGAVFGIGSTADKAFWVEIKVTGVPVGGAYDFFTNACQAEWRSAAGVLPCPGTDGDSKGFVLKQDAPKLENGTTSSEPGLLTAPQNIFNGYIQGTYPAFKVQAGDRFQSIVNCESGATSCYARFRLDYQVGTEPVKTLWSFLERYEGLYYRADVDLSPLAGKEVKFALVVSSYGFANGDRAQWVAPRITRPGATEPAATTTPVTATITRTPTIDPSVTQGPTATPGTPSVTPTFTPPPVNEWLLYQNTQYGFFFKVPPGSVNVNNIDTHARITIPVMAPGTNLIEKYVDADIIVGAASSGTCQNLTPGLDPSQDQEVTINGIDFLKQAGSSAAAGNTYDWVGYSAPHRNNCVSLTFALHYANLGNYTTPPPEYDKAAESAVFEQVMNTLFFLP